MKSEILRLFDNDTYIRNETQFQADEIIAVTLAFKTTSNMYGDFDKVNGGICLRVDIKIKNDFNTSSWYDIGCSFSKKHHIKDLELMYIYGMIR